jgi:hypothetical protein
VTVQLASGEAKALWFSQTTHALTRKPSRTRAFFAFREVLMAGEIMPRADGLITRGQAAALCGVTPEAITNWVRLGYGPKHDRRKLPVKRRDAGGHPLFDPVEVAKAEHTTAPRARRVSRATLAA